MKERQLPFKPEMVRATLREVDPKTQTRRLFKPPKALRHPHGANFMVETRGGRHEFTDWETDQARTRLIECPYGKPGDHLWVREAWAAPHAVDHLPPRLIQQGTRIHYLADESKGGLRGRPGMFMPRWASRITLEVTEVRVERLNDISEADAIAEGVERDRHGWSSYGRDTLPQSTAKDSYCCLWESINGAGSWALNPSVWVVAFKRLPATT